MILVGDCREHMATIETASIDAIVTDPPYGLAFMGKAWDHGVPGMPFWRDALRVATPGAYLLAFGGTRTFHRLTCAIEDAGWEVKDCLVWLYGQGFPKHKSLLKPGWEPIVLAKKPGAGALNIDGCRIEAHVSTVRGNSADMGYHGGLKASGNGYTTGSDLGRWPANVILDERAGELLDAQTGTLSSGKLKGSYKGGGTKGIYGEYGYAEKNFDSNAGGASRFFYCAKASRSEREIGMDGVAEKPLLWSAGEQSPGTFQSDGTKRAARNNHPTVKPLSLMRWLVRLVTPPGGTVLDPFAGSGTTGMACELEGFPFVGMEISEDYADIADRRIGAAAATARQAWLMEVG